MFRHIVVPLDGSGFSKTAIPYALALASGSETVVELVSAVDPAWVLSGAGYFGSLTAGAAGYGSGTEVPAGTPDLIEASRRSVEKELQSTAERVRKETEAVIRWELLDGEPSEAVAAQVERSSADLLVMSTHGRGGLERAWLGSVADRLIRHVRTPLLLVRPGEEDRGPQEPSIRRVLVPLDGSELAEGALTPAVRVARQVEASLELLRVVNPAMLTESPYIPATPEDSEEYAARQRKEAQSYLTGVAERLRADGVEVAEVGVHDGAPASTILGRAAAGADLIAMATHGRGGLKRWLVGSVSDKVLRGADVPVMLVRPNDETR